jgi:hypothetical protein
LPEAALRENLERMLGVLPEVSSKYSWQREGTESIAPFGSLNLRYDYGVVNRKDEVETIKYTVKAKYVKPQQDLGVLEVVKGDVRTERGDGVVLFNADKGMLIRGEQLLRIRGTLTLKTAPAQTDDMTFISDTRLTWRKIE